MVVVVVLVVVCAGDDKKYSNPWFHPNIQNSGSAYSHASIYLYHIQFDFFVSAIFHVMTIDAEYIYTIYNTLTSIKKSSQTIGSMLTY